MWIVNNTRIEIVQGDITKEHVDAVVNAANSRLAGGGETALVRVDATALLWRLKLEGLDVAERFAAVADGWQASLEGEGGFYAFNDFHAALAFAAAGRREALARSGRVEGRAFVFVV